MSKYSFGGGLPTWNGVPMVGGFPQGLTNVFFVDYGVGSDGYGVKSNSITRPFQTLAKAIDVATTNKNEGIALIGNTTHTLAAIESITKNRLHIFGYDPGGRMYGQNAKVNIGITTDTSDTAAVQNTGVRNSFTNIKFMSANTLTQAVYCFAEGGEYTVFNGCEFYKSTHLTTAGAAEVLCNGDSAQFYNCVFGDLVNERGGASTPRANVLLSRESITGKVARDVSFYDCQFLQKAAHVDANFLYGSGTTDVERRMLLINPIFWNCVLATADPADCITFGGAQTEGDVLLVNPSGINVTAFAEASQNVYVTGPVPTHNTTGIAVEVAA